MRSERERLQSRISEQGHRRRDERSREQRERRRASSAHLSVDPTSLNPRLHMAASSCPSKGTTQSALSSLSGAVDGFVWSPKRRCSAGHRWRAGWALAIKIWTGLFEAGLRTRRFWQVELELYSLFGATCQIRQAPSMRQTAPRARPPCQIPPPLSARSHPSPG